MMSRDKHYVGGDGCRRRARRPSRSSSAPGRSKARLDAGDQLDVTLRVRTRTPAGALETITHPVVSTGLGRVAAARQTGRMSVSRGDSSWQ
jgi:hypothetical protein